MLLLFITTYSKSVSSVARPNSTPPLLLKKKSACDLSRRHAQKWPMSVSIHGGRVHLSEGFWLSAPVLARSAATRHVIPPPTDASHAASHSQNHAQLSLSHSFSSRFLSSSLSLSLSLSFSLSPFLLLLSLSFFLRQQSVHRKGGNGRAVD